jgi:hypothetical protein
MPGIFGVSNTIKRTALDEHETDCALAFGRYFALHSLDQWVDGSIVERAVRDYARFRLTGNHIEGFKRLWGQGTNDPSIRLMPVDDRAITLRAQCSHAHLLTGKQRAMIWRELDGNDMVGIYRAFTGSQQWRNRHRELTDIANLLRADESLWIGGLARIIIGRGLIPLSDDVKYTRREAIVVCHEIRAKRAADALAGNYPIS